MFGRVSWGACAQLLYMLHRQVSLRVWISGAAVPYLKRGVHVFVHLAGVGLSDWEHLSILGDTDRAGGAVASITSMSSSSDSAGVSIGTGGDDLSGTTPPLLHVYRRAPCHCCPRLCSIHKHTPALTHWQSTALRATTAPAVPQYWLKHAIWHLVPPP